MKTHKKPGFVWIAMWIVGVLSVPAASQTAHTEDFTTTIYKDTLNTTAFWDTVAGEMKLAPFPLTLAGAVITPDRVYDMAISGDFAYVANFAAGLAVIYIRNPANPLSVGSYDTPGFAEDVAVAGIYAYVADGSAGLEVIDIRYPTNPSLAGSYNTGGNAKGIAIDGDHAFVADYSAGLVVIDISDPTNPSLAGSYDTPGYALGVDVSGDYAYVADHSYGLRVIDISDPSNPSPTGSYDRLVNAYGVAVSGDYAYVTDYTSGLLVFDVGYPSTPSLVGSYVTPNQSWNITISGDYAYIADGSSGIQVVDIKDPTNPYLAGTYDSTDQTHGVAVAGEYAYAGDFNGGFKVIEACVFKVPSLVGSTDISDFSRSVDIEGNYAYVANGSSGLRTIDISDPANPSLAGVYNTPGHSWDVAVAGNHAYIADGGSGLQVIDVFYPTGPSLAGSYNTPGDAHGVAVAGDHAYIADELSGLMVIDIVDPTNPSLVGSYSTPGISYDVTVDGDRAYVADGTFGLQIFDISDPANPALAGAYNTPGDSWGVAVHGEYAYVCDGTSGLLVIDATNPLIPLLVGSYDTPNFAVGVDIAGDYAFLADYGSDGSGGLRVFDISTPAGPTLVGSSTAPGRAIAVDLAGDYAYVADEQSGLKVIWAFQRYFDTANNTGQSIQINSTNHDVAFVSVSSSYSDSIQWEVSANGGADWQEVAADASVEILTVPGNDLRWRSTHVYSQPFVNPACSNLSVDWRHEFPLFDAVNDIPNDQGRQVSISWTASGYDHVGSPTPVMEYAVYRKIDDDLSMSSGAERSATRGDKKPAKEDGRGRLPAYPPGDWHFLMTIPADCEDSYAAVVSTLADSTIANGMYYTTFFVSALTATPGVYFDSPPDSGYSLDNLSPTVPSGFLVVYAPEVGNELTWEACPDDDFECFRIYRGESEEFDPSPGNLVHTATDSDWLDTVEDGWRYCYKITAVDDAGNESPPASSEPTTGAVAPVAPGAYALHQNVPNPFNPTTSIVFDIPAPTHARLTVYNLKGQLVRVLLDTDVDAGSRRITWDGRDFAGRGVASGVYFYRLETPAFTESRKMVLLR